MRSEFERISQKEVLLNAVVSERRDKLHLPKCHLAQGRRQLKLIGLASQGREGQREREGEREKEGERETEGESECAKERERGGKRERDISGIDRKSVV